VADLSHSDGLATLAEVHEAVRAELGVKLFTILAFTDEGKTLHRIYSSHPQQYPVGGSKNVASAVAAEWVTRCRDEQAPYFGPTRDDVRRIFTDSALIESLGCSSIINVPVVRHGVSIGALNILDAEGTYSDAHIEMARRIAQRAADIVDQTIGELP
jgi:GAF domain-containing protein